MPALNSSTLFHYTRSEDILRKILVDGLKYYKIAEKIPGRNLGYITRGVCFCNIPLSNVEQHVSWYGEYSIGFKRSELKKHGCSPVIYAHTDTPFLLKGSSLLAKKWYEDNPLMTCYIKRNEGEQKKRHCKKRKYKDFTKEMEWRLVSGNVRILQISNLGELEELDPPKVSPPNIKISPDMIEYIILSKKEEVPPFCDWLKKAFPTNYIDYITKIITIAQISRDF